MVLHIPADYRDFPGDSPERQAASLAAAGALCNEWDLISDWGDFDRDFDDDTHDVSEGVIARPPGFAASLDVGVFYDQCRAEDIKICDRNND